MPHWVLFSPAFHPKIGGLETVIQVLASQWSKLGIKVTVITDTTFDGENPFDFDVERKSSFLQKIRIYRSADAVIFANISLWGFLPLLLCFGKTPAWIATHHGWYENFGKPIKILDRVKKKIAQYADANISVSKAVDSYLRLNGEVIPNPYDQTLFRRLPNIERVKNFVFLGRLVSDKGADMLINAFVELKKDKIIPTLTIIGTGPEKDKLEKLVLEQQLDKQITFTGALVGESLVQQLNQHQTLVVPSRWNEPFGVVALEGIACGCSVIGSAGGGLKEAIGLCGITFTNGDVMELVAALKQAYLNPSINWTDKEITQNHLMLHHPDRVAANYAKVINSVVNH
jgi:glycosyltransferase involved in cell wall biosynthesis